MYSFTQTIILSLAAYAVSADIPLVTFGADDATTFTFVELK